MSKLCLEFKDHQITGCTCSEDKASMTKPIDLGNLAFTKEELISALGKIWPDYEYVSKEDSIDADKIISILNTMLAEKLAQGPVAIGISIGIEPVKPIGSEES